MRLFAVINAMKRQFAMLALAVVALGFTITARASDRWETLRAINWVENPTNQTHVGRFGELGPYQFRSGTWRMHTDKPFSLAVDRAAADEVAVKHYEWIKRTLEHAGVEANAFNIALSWNCGVDAVLSGRAPSVSYSYAERVTNLVETFKERARSMAEEAVRPAPAEQVQPKDDHSDRDELRFRVLQNTPRFVIASAG